MAMSRTDEAMLAGQSPAYIEGFLSVRSDSEGSCGAGYSWVNDKRAERGGYCRRSKKQGNGAAGAVGKALVVGAVGAGLTVAAQKGKEAYDIRTNPDAKRRRAKEMIEEVAREVKQLGGQRNMKPEDRARVEAKVKKAIDLAVEGDLQKAAQALGVPRAAKALDKKRVQLGRAIGKIDRKFN